MYKDPILPFVGHIKLNEIENLIINKDLVNTEQIKLLHLFHYFIYVANKLTYLGVSRLKEASAEINLLELECLRREEMGCQNLNE